MTQTSKTYYIRTEERVYNSINSQEHMQKVRKNLGDRSAVVDAFRIESRIDRQRDEWVRFDGSGW